MVRSINNVSLYGVSAKNVKMFEGMEGVGFSADLLIDKKPVGRVYDDARGASYEYEFLSPEAKELFLERRDKFFAVHPMYYTFKCTKETFDKNNVPIADEEFYKSCASDEFISKLLDRREYFATWRSYKKKGYEVLVIVDHYYIPGTPLPRTTQFAAIEMPGQRPTT